MSSIKGTQTEKNLLAAFAGESQARNRYEMSAKIAKKEGYEQIAAIFQQTADHERMHAKMFFSHLEGGTAEITASYPAGGLGTTLENLKHGAAGELEEHSELYPAFAAVAEQEGFPKVAKQFRWVSNAEKFHEERYNTLIDMVEKQTVHKREEQTPWMCRVCGYIHEGLVPPEKCPNCNHPKGHFEKLNLDF